MNGARVRAVFAQDFRHAGRRPLIWVLVLVLVLLTWGLSTGSARIATGSSDVGGTKAFITSEFAIAQMLSVVIFIFYAFFVAVAAGMAVIQDDELKVGEVLHSTPLRPSEYIWGKFLAVLAAFVLVLGLHLLACMAFYHAPASASVAEFRGPFELMNYLRPALLLGLPGIVFLAGTAFWVGERSRRPILVFVLPVTLLLLCSFFLWFWNPSWLDARINHALMLIDPAGVRWIRETWLSVDRGVDFYNSEPVLYDGAFVASRVALVLIGLLGVVFAKRHFQSTLRGERGPSLASLPARSAAAPALGTSGLGTPALGTSAHGTSAHGALSGDGAATIAAAAGRPAGDSSRFGAGSSSARHAARAVSQARTEARPLAALFMRTEPPTWWEGFVSVARVELRELASQAGLYLFVPLIVLQTLGGALSAVGPFDTAMLSTPGLLASGAMNTLVLLLCLLLLFYNTESLQRERRTGLLPIVDGAGVSTASVLLGKCVANGLVVIVVLAATLLTCLGVLLAQGSVPVSLLPFVQLWGLLLPTLLLWSAFVTLIYVLVKSRYTTYAIGLAALGASGYAQASGHMNWVGNWYLWGATHWSDLGSFELDGRALLWNRIFVLGLAALCMRLAVRWHARRAGDAAQVVERFAPLRLLRGLAVMLPWMIVPIASGAWLWHLVAQGYQGDVAQKQDKDYWRKNVQTWKDSPVPALADMELFVDLDPSRRWFAVSGSYLLVNRTDLPLATLPISAGDWVAPPATRPDVAVPLLGAAPDATPSADTGTATSAVAADAVVNAADTAATDGPQWTLDGRPIKVKDSAQLWLVQPTEPLAPGASVRLGFRYAGTFPRGISENGAGASEFILPSGVVLTCFGTSFAPVIGFMEGRGVDKDNASDAREYPEGYRDGVLEPALGYGVPFTTRITLRGPQDYTLNSVGTRTADTVDEATGLRTTEWVSDHPVHFFNIVCGRWAERRGDGTVIYYDPGHPFNIETMGAALDAARRLYSEWFGAYPWQELKLSEFPALAGYAQGFPTNITFSEGIGFLNDDDPRSAAAFAVTAHESAHQWWGNILVPGKAPGGAVLAEGMSHFSALMLLDAVKGERDRLEFAKRLETRYANSRQKDDERSLARVDGSRAGDTSVIYDRGGLVLWMLSRQMGRQEMFAGLRAFIEHWSAGPDHPVMEDLLDSLRPFAADKPAFDAFAASWILGTDVPEYRITDAVRTPLPGATGRWQVTCQLTNAGSGSPTIDVAAVRGTRFPDDDTAPGDTKTAADPEDDYREVRTAVRLAPGQSGSIVLTCDFEPTEVLVDPDVQVLMLKREAGRSRF